MATSSIRDNFTINEAKAARAFVDAVERASRVKSSKRRVAVGRRIVGRDAVRVFLLDAAFLNQTAMPIPNF